MNGVLAFVIALVFYPGIFAGFAAAWVLSWARDAARASLGAGTLPKPLGALAEVRAAFARDTLIPSGVHEAVLGLVPVIAFAAPLAALVLLPVPGNPLASALGLQGDLVAEAALLLVVPFARLLIGWATPSPYTRLAADRDARLLAGCVVPMVLALAAIAQQVNAFGLTLADAPSVAHLSWVAFAARLLAAAAFACCVPVIARAAALREGDGAAELAAGELTEANGRDLAFFRIAEALQLVAALVFFAAAFVVPLLANAPAGVRTAAWVVVPLVGAAAVGAWEGMRGAPSSQHGETPPLSWWFGLPLLLALFALVAASFAARGV
jgi:formate hydrogenlyase subunit 4